MSIAAPLVNAQIESQLRSHLRVYTVAHDQPLIFWRPVTGYLFTFDTEIILRRERVTERPFGVLLLPQMIWPLAAHRLTHLVTSCQQTATIGWLSSSALSDLFVHCPQVATFCIERMMQAEMRLGQQVGQALRRTALPRTAQLLLDLWELSDRQFIHWSQAELATVLNTHRESMSVWLNELRQRGLIRLHQRRIEVLNRWALQQIAEDY